MTFSSSERSRLMVQKVQKVQTPDSQDKHTRQQPGDIIGLLGFVYEHHQAHIGLRRGDGLEDIEKAADGMQVFKSSADGVVSIERIGILGVRIDYSGPGHHGLPEVCEIVHGEVQALDGLVGGFIMDQAIAGTTPDWMPGAWPRMGPVASRRYDAGKGNADRYAMIMDHHGHTIGTYVEPKLTLDNIKAARRIYRGWWLALESLADRLTQCGLEVTGPTAEFEPWIINSLLAALDRTWSPEKKTNKINHLICYG